MLLGLQDGSVGIHPEGSAPRWARLWMGLAAEAGQHLPRLEGLKTEERPAGEEHLCED